MAFSAPPDRDTLRRRTGITECDLRCVSSSAIFSGRSFDELANVLIDSAVQEFPRNTILFLQGDPAQRFYIVLRGWVKVFRETRDGRESVLHVFGTGESFAEAAIFEPTSYPASASACVDVRVLGIPAASFRGRLVADRNLSESFMRTMTLKLRTLTQQVEQLSARSATERLASFLSELCPAGAETAVVRLPLEKSVIAARLGMQPETFSRSISKLRSVGVGINGDTVSIANVGALRELSEGEALDRDSRLSWTDSQGTMSD